jgi:arginine decarboxylase
MPGMDVSGTFAQRGIPAQIVTMFLDEQRIEIEKTGDYIMLVLFSIGMTKGKWGTLLDGLLGFKRAYDTNTPAARRAPEARRAHPDRYGALGLADLCDEMHDALRTSRMPALLDSAFDALPEAKLTPADAYRRLVRGRSERLSARRDGRAHRDGDGRPLPTRNPDPDARRERRPGRRSAP